jgi:hypothetical protein
MVAPRSLASSTKRKAIGWFSAMLEPMMTTQSEFARSHCAVVAAPRPNVVPKLGTDELCHMRAWFSIQTMPRPAPHSFLIK